MVKDYDFEILYHQGKANVMVGALSHKATSVLIRDVYLSMTVTSPLMDMIKGAQVEALKKDSIVCSRQPGVIDSV